MHDEIQLTDLRADELRELLAGEGCNLSPQQIATLRAFVEHAGGLENALAAFESLAQAKAA